MNRMTNGNQWRETHGGLVAVSGKRELHLLGTSVTSMERAKEMLATMSFSKLVGMAQKHPITKNTFFLKVA